MQQAHYVLSPKGYSGSDNLQRSCDIKITFTLKKN